MSEFEIEFMKKGPKAFITLSGYLNENTKFPVLVYEETSSVEVNFENLRMVNSTGIAAWIKWIADCSSKIHFDFHNCGKEIIEQINAVRGFLPENCTLHSLYVPYYCEELDKTEKLLLKRGADYHEKTSEQKKYVYLPNHKVGQYQYSPDIILDRYFMFLNRQ